MTPHPVRRISAVRRAVTGMATCVLAAAMAGPGCAPSIKDPAVPVALPEAFRRTGEAEVPAKWWTAFGDDRLNELIEQALRDNLTLAGAWARLEQARAAARRSGAALLPSVDGSAGASRTASAVEPFATTHDTSYSLGLTASYEVDIWGRVRSTRDAARMDAAATREDLQAAAITVAASVAETWFSLIEQAAQIRLLDEQMETNSKLLELITLRYGQGKVSATDVLQQRQLLEATRGEKVRAEAAEALLRHQLAILLGRAPADLDAKLPAKLPELPPLPAPGVPAEWLHRRPDVRSALLRVQAADHRIAAAIADKFPRLSLSATATTTAERIRDLFDNWMASMAANVIAPLFDAGLRTAEVDRARAAASESFRLYGQTVLTALKEVEDALVQEAQQRRLLESLGKQRDLARQSAQRTQEQYAKGAVEFLRYLTALLDYQRLQRSHLAARRELVAIRVDLYRSLGARWDLQPPVPEPRRVRGPLERLGTATFGRNEEGQ